MARLKDIPEQTRTIDKNAAFPIEVIFSPISFVFVDSGSSGIPAAGKTFIAA